MNPRSKTADERFVLCLYEAVSASGDADTPFNRYEIGKKASIHPKGVDAICKLLVQANFIKKAGEDNIVLTSNGERLALKLLMDK